MRPNLALAATLTADHAGLRVTRAASRVSSTGERSSGGSGSGAYEQSE